MDENMTLKQQINKLRDENKNLNQKLLNYMGNMNEKQ